MLNSNEIKSYKFGEARKGYSSVEVDELLDKICEDYISFEKLVAEKQARIEALEKEISDNKSSAESINTVLISAQKLADSIVADAKKNAEQIVSDAETDSENIKQRTKKALEEIDAVLTEQKSATQKEAEEILTDAKRKAEAMMLAAKDSVAREQILFDKLKAEVASFKKEIKESYKKHLESLSSLPDEVPFNAEQSAEATLEIIKNGPDFSKFVPQEETKAEETAVEPELVAEETAEETAVEDEKTSVVDEIVNDVATGFVIKKPATPEETIETESEEPSLKKGFFVKENN